MEIKTMENKYETPVITVITFNNEDIIRTSGGVGTNDTKNDLWNGFLS